MAYMARMGLWGPGTAFNGFEQFLDSMKKRGVSFLEMLAMEMKASAVRVIRSPIFVLAVLCGIRTVEHCAKTGRTDPVPACGPCRQRASMLREA